MFIYNIKMNILKHHFGDIDVDGSVVLKCILIRMVNVKVKVKLSLCFN
jgi:hypothetical protein